MSLFRRKKYSIEYSNGYYVVGRPYIFTTSDICDTLEEAEERIKYLKAKDLEEKKINKELRRRR